MMMFSLLFAGDKMKLIFQSFLCCCLLATVAHCVEFDAKPQLKKRWVGVIQKMLQMFQDATVMVDQRHLPSPKAFFLLFQVKYIAEEQTEKRSGQSVSREERRVAALCQTRGYQGHAAATFQVKR